jgi:hypothetical protein
MMGCSQQNIGSKMELGANLRPTSPGRWIYWIEDDSDWRLGAILNSEGLGHTDTKAGGTL